MYVRTNIYIPEQITITTLQKTKSHCQKDNNSKHSNTEGDEKHKLELNSTIKSKI